jgi:hypothetical protein
MNLGTYMLASDPSSSGIYRRVIRHYLATKFEDYLRKQDPKNNIRIRVKKVSFSVSVLRRYAFGTVLKVLDFGFIFKNKYLETISNINLGFFLQISF